MSVGLNEVEGVDVPNSETGGGGLPAASCFHLLFRLLLYEASGINVLHDFVDKFTVQHL